MEMVREIAFVNGVGAMDPALFSFAVEAIRIQMHRDFLPAWLDHLPVHRPVEVVGYTRTTDLAPGSFAPILILPSLDREDVLGDHGGLELADIAWGRSLPDETVMSHEGLELAGNPFGNRWAALPSGVVTASEVADAVENESYEIQATVGGQTRPVMVSNFVYPAWFGLGSGTRFDHMGTCETAGDYSNGYIIARNDDGTTVNLFGSRATPEYRAKVQAKLEQRSRTQMLHRAWPLAETQDHTHAGRWR